MAVDAHRQSTLRYPHQIEKSQFDLKAKIRNQEWVIGYPPIFSVSMVPICYLVSNAFSTAAEFLRRTIGHLTNHILVCSGNYDVLQFICTLRSKNLTDREFRSIVILCRTVPTPEECVSLALFPEVYVKIGDPHKKPHLIEAGIEKADRVVITNMKHQARDVNDHASYLGFEDSPAIMVAHLVFDMFQSKGILKTTIIELEHESNLKFLGPASRKIVERQKTNTLKTMGAAKVDLYEVLHNDHYTPSYAAGRVICTNMLETFMYQLHFQPSILDLVRSFCGIRSETDSADSEEHKCASICCIKVPDECVGGNYLHLYEVLTTYLSVVPIGIMRDDIYAGLGNSLPFIITNPLPCMLLRAHDLVYVLATSDQLA